jgi:hypothetical protein
VSYPYDELDIMGAGAEDRDWTMRALHAMARASAEPMLRGRAKAEQLLAFLEAFVDEVETYGAAWSCGSSEEEQEDAARIDTVTQGRLRGLAVKHEQLLPLLRSPRHPLEVESTVSVLTDLRHVDAFFVNGPLWIDRVKGLVLRLLAILSRLVTRIARALRDALQQATVEPDLIEQREVERGPPRKSGRTHRRSRVGFGLRARNDGEGGCVSPPSRPRPAAA